MLKGKKTYAVGGLFLAILASMCCIVPFIFLLLGISGAWISYVTVMAPYQPLFIMTSLGFLGAGFWKVYRKPKAACDEGSFCATPQSDKFAKMALWMATLLIVSALSIELIAPLL